MSFTPNHNIDIFLHCVTVCTSVVIQLTKSLTSISFQDITASVRKGSRYPTPLDAGREAMSIGLHMIGSILSFNNTV